MSKQYPTEYPTYEDREDSKKEGWTRIHESTCPREKAGYFLNRIIWSHYWRARGEIEAQRNCKTLLKKIRGTKYYPFYELDMDHYIPNWLHANKKMVPQDVLDVIKDQWGYEPEENKYLPEGRTSYLFSTSQ